MQPHLGPDTGFCVPLRETGKRTIGPKLRGKNLEACQGSGMRTGVSKDKARLSEAGPWELSPPQLSSGSRVRSVVDLQCGQKRIDRTEKEGR